MAIFFLFFSIHLETMKVKKVDLPPSPPEDILPSLDDEADEDTSIDDGKFLLRTQLCSLF